MEPRLAPRLPLLVLPPLLAGALLALVIHSVGAAPAATARFASATGAGFLCLKDNPCRLSIAVNDATTGDSIYVKGGTYTGVGAAVITVTKSITIYGGWDGDPAPGRPYRNPALYPTTLDGQNVRRAVVITGTIQPTLEGFIIARGNATGLFAGCSAPQAYGCGGGMFVYHAAARISNNTFISNTAMLTATDSQQLGHGGGLYVDVGSGAIISHNVFMSNTAAAVFLGEGGGLDIFGAPSVPLVVQNNQFIGNQANTYGGGASIEDYANVVMVNNVFHNNASGLGAGLYSYAAASVDVDHNTFSGNTGEEPAFLGYFVGTFQNNQLVDNATAAGLSVLYGDNVSLALVVDNIIAHNGFFGIYAAGAPAEPLTLLAYHNTLVGSGAGIGVWVFNVSATVRLTNTLISGFSTGLTTDYPTSTILSANYVLFDTNVGAAGNATLAHAFSGAPAFANPALRDYHLLAQSAARDAGVQTLIALDFEGDPRLIGPKPDLGADETRFVHALELPLVRR